MRKPGIMTYRKSEHDDGRQGIDILKPTYQVAAKAGRLSIDMPILRQQFKGSSKQ